MNLYNPCSRLRWHWYEVWKAGAQFVLNIELQVFCEVDVCENFEQMNKFRIQKTWLHLVLCFQNMKNLRSWNVIPWMLLFFNDLPFNDAPLRRFLSTWIDSWLILSLPEWTILELKIRLCFRIDVKRMIRLSSLEKEEEIILNEK